MEDGRVTGVSINFFIKDTLFQNILLETFGDSFLASDVEQIDCSNKNISSLEGIHIFANLKRLNCSHNQLQAIDISSLVNLEFLDCRYNNIGELDLRALSKLESVDCRGNNNIRVMQPIYQSPKFLILLQD